MYCHHDKIWLIVRALAQDVLKGHTKRPVYCHKS